MLEMLKSSQGVVESSDEVVDVLNATGDANEGVSDAEFQSVLLKHVRVRHDCASGDD